MPTKLNKKKINPQEVVPGQSLYIKWIDGDYTGTVITIIDKTKPIVRFAYDDGTWSNEDLSKESFTLNDPYVPEDDLYFKDPVNHKRYKIAGSKERRNTGELAKVEFMGIGNVVLSDDESEDELVILAQTSEQSSSPATTSSAAGTVDSSPRPITPAFTVAQDKKRQRLEQTAKELSADLSIEVDTQSTLIVAIEQYEAAIRKRQRTAQDLKSQMPSVNLKSLITSDRSLFAPEDQAHMQKQAEYNALLCKRLKSLGELVNVAIPQASSHASKLEP